MNELDLLRRIRRMTPAPGPGVIAGIGDDCAIYRPPGACEDLLFTTDMMIEDVHFRRETHPADSVGWKALARGLSDIAAMGGEPRFCLLSLALASWADQRWIDGFYRGFLRLARRTGTTLAGGDLAHADRTTCDVAVCGAVPLGKALRRDGAQPGDGIYVSGRLGGAALGLATHRGAAWKKHSLPEPRLEFGRTLRDRASAAIDLSDGLSLDLHRLSLASGVSAALEEAIPLFPGAGLDQALHGGEDYELLFTARAGVEGAIRIGAIRKGRAGRVIFQGKTLAPGGYDHFRSSALR
ncbi:MAG: thiamine-phosphate kinase [Bryobacteraceae bacterium]